MERKEPKNYLIACGTSDYAYLDADGQLESVRGDVARVVNILTTHFGYEHVLVDDLRFNPTEQSLKRGFAKWLQCEDIKAIDRVVFYYSGHGVTSDGEHYLFLEDSELDCVGQSALSTVELVKPLGNPKVKVKQILYIIDTCFAGQGAVDIVEHAEKILEKCSIDEQEPLSVYVIAASRTQQTASPSLFSTAFEHVLMRLGQQCDRQSRPTGILPSELIEAIRTEINDPEQHVNYRQSGSEGRTHFFHFIAPALQAWKDRRRELVSSFVDKLERKLEPSLFFINSFLLAKQLTGQFVLDGGALSIRMMQLSSLPVDQQICPLLLCSEWCRVRFADEYDDDRHDPDIVAEIERWQQEVIAYRPDADLVQIQASIDGLTGHLRDVLENEKLRIQIEVERERDQTNNTGQGSGAFLLSVSLCVENELVPLGQFARKRRLDPDGDVSLQGLLNCLEQDQLLSDLIRQARYSFDSFCDINVDLAVEVFLPFDLLGCSLDQISFECGPFLRTLGSEYPIFINSYERYFDRLYREIKDAIARKKKEIWDQGSRDPEPFPMGQQDALTSVKGNEFVPYDVFLGSKPTEPILKLIVTSLPIAIWSRDDQVDIAQVLAGAEWTDWPNLVKELRMDNNQANVTFFWDDDYPKPSVRTRSFNTSVVSRNGRSSRSG